VYYRNITRKGKVSFVGLDMYLSARQFTAKKVVNSELYDTLVKDIPFAGDTATVETQVAYWRKSNQIHAWFVENIQNGSDDCREYYVSREKLQMLLDICELVLLDRENAHKLLPTREGFFFGSSDYDDWYFEDIQDTVTQLKDVLKNVPEDWELRYQSSW
jgi:hypothetical protein